MRRPSSDEVCARAEGNRGPPPRPSVGTLKGWVLIVCAALVIVFAGASVLTVPGCLPKPSCTPNIGLCIGGEGAQGVPGICASTGREYAASEPRVTCAEVGGVCRVLGNTAGCVPPDSDAGASDAPEGGAR